jgi:hypothetical protein
MFERSSDGNGSSDYFLLGCSNKPPIDSSRRLNRIGVGIEINRG